MRLRMVITVTVLILYVGLFNVYLYDLTRIKIENTKILYNCLQFMAVSTFAFDVAASFVNSHHRQFSFLLILCVLVNYILIIFTHAQWIKNTDAMFYSFNFSVFIITLTIFFCEIRYKTFK